MYLVPTNNPSILTSFPVPYNEKHHSMMLPSPCFTVGMMFSKGVIRGFGFVSDIPVFLDGQKGIF